jgi:uncharacterized membrane protein
MMLAGIAGSQVALAAQKDGINPTVLPPGQEEPLPEDSIKLESKFPVLSAESGEIFEFSIELKYQGVERKRFDLTLITPSDWRAVVVASFPEKQIPAIEMGPAENFPVTENIKVQFGAVGKLPEPGDYVVTLEVSSGDLKDTIELTAVVTARFELIMFTETGRLNTKATAGEDNHFSIRLVNSGSAAIDDITFSSTKPQGWTITFNPEKMESLGEGLTQEMDVVISPPSKTIAGDYEITLRAESGDVSPDSLKIRVTVLTPTIWGWVGVLIVLAVIAGVGVIFWRLGRR